MATGAGPPESKALVPEDRPQPALIHLPLLTICTALEASTLSFLQDSLLIRNPARAYHSCSPTPKPGLASTDLCYSRHKKKKVSYEFSLTSNWPGDLDREHILPSGSRGDKYLSFIHSYIPWQHIFNKYLLIIYGAPTICRRCQRYSREYIQEEKT